MRRTGPYQPGRAELSHVKDESFYPWEGGNQSPKKSLSQPSKKGVTEITYKLHIDGAILPWFSNPSLPHRHSGTSQCSHDGTKVLPCEQESSFWPCLSFLPHSSPLRSFYRCRTFWNLHQISTHRFSGSGTSHIWSVTTKKVWKNASTTSLTLRPAASVPSWNPNWYCASPLWRVNRLTTKGSNPALQSTGCFGTMKCMCYNWQRLASEKKDTERVTHSFNGEINEEWWS